MRETARNGASSGAARSKAAVWHPREVLWFSKSSGKETNHRKSQSGGDEVLFLCANDFTARATVSQLVAMFNGSVRKC